MDIYIYDPLRYRLCIIVFKSYSLTFLSRRKMVKSVDPQSRPRFILEGQPRAKRSARKLTKEINSSSAQEGLRKIPFLLPFRYTEQNEQTLRHDSHG